MTRGPPRVIAAYSSSSAVPVAYDSRSAGVSANAVSPMAATSPFAFNARNMATVAGM